MKFDLVLLCFAAVFSLFFISTAYSVNLTATYDDATSKTVYIVKQKLKLNCNSSEEVSSVKWEKNGEDVINVSELDKRYVTKNPQTNVYTFSIDKTDEDDIGNYTCSAYDKNNIRTAFAEMKVVTQVLVKVPTNINVVEGEKLKIECQTLGRPSIRWTYAEEGVPDNRTDLKPDDRISFKVDEETKVENSILEITNIQMSDRGNYTCWGHPQTGSPKAATSSCMIRVKSRYAALWPFLGICVEVFVLCLIIFIYEKKRNKTELEESDTDQSPDQKNTPDHGKDSNLRHRQ